MCNCLCPLGRQKTWLEKSKIWTSFPPSVLPFYINLPYFDNVHLLYILTSPCLIFTKHLLPC